MPVFTQNFTIDQGADFVWVSPQYIVNEVVQNLSGSACRMQLRTDPNDQGAALALTNVSTANGSVTPNADGTITIDITRVATGALIGGALYLYDVFVDLTSGSTVRILGGTILLAPAITH